jgi:hypothetical protein
VTATLTPRYPEWRWRIKIYAGETLEQSDTPAKLTGRLVLTNTSRDQTVRLVSGKLRYVNTAGRPINVEDTRTEPTIKFAASGIERLDPGQEVTESLEVDFPASALTASTLKAIHVDLVYIPSAYREASARFGVAIGAK